MTEPRRFAAILLLSLALAGRSTAADFTFAALGDTPYNADEEERFVELIAGMNREPLAFALHVGDFKSGNSPCSDALYRRRREWFDLSRHPFVYVPGDNDWTDCWRALGAAREPRERLRRLREIFFTADGLPGQRGMRVERQSDGGPDYPEHLRWTHQGIVFVSLNMPGGDNNRRRMPAESAERTRAAVAWLRAAFGAARAGGSPALFVAMQANPWTAGGGIRAAYAELMSALTAETLAFDGEVVLVHGDTHRHRVDRPLVAEAAGGVVGNFTRIEVYGSPFVDWVRVRVETGPGRARITVTPGSPAPPR